MTDERAVIAVPDERGVLRATRLDELTWRPSAYAIVTADGSWSALDLGVDVVSIRGGT